MSPVEYESRCVQSNLGHRMPIALHMRSHMRPGSAAGVRKNVVYPNRPLPSCAETQMFDSVVSMLNSSRAVERVD